MGKIFDSGEEVSWGENLTLGLGTGFQIAGLVSRRRDRKESARQFDLSYGLQREQWDFTKRQIEEQEERKRRIRNLVLGFGGKK